MLKYADYFVETVGDVDSYRRRGISFLQIYNYEKALLDYKKALELDPNSGEQYDEVGHCYQYMGRYEEAIEYYTQGIPHLLENQKLRLLENLSDCYVMIGAYEQAIAQKEEILKLDKNQLFIWGEIGDCYCKLKRFKEAKRAYKKMGVSVIQQGKMGEYWIQQGKLKKALFCFEKAAKLTPIGEKKEVWNQLAQFHLFYRNDMEKAFQGYQGVFHEAKTMKEQYQGRLNLALSSFLRGNGKQAYEYAKEAQEDMEKMGYTSEEEYIIYGSENLLEAYEELTTMHLCLGTYEKMALYLGKMGEIVSLQECAYGFRIMFSFLQGFYFEIIGEGDKAIVIYEKILEERNILLIRIRIDQIKSKN